MFNIANDNLKEFCELEKNLFNIRNASKSIEASGFTLQAVYAPFFSYLKSGLKNYRLLRKDDSLQYKDLLQELFWFSPAENEVIFSTTKTSGSARLTTMINRISKNRGLNYRFAPSDAPKLTEWAFTLHQAYEEHFGADCTLTALANTIDDTIGVMEVEKQSAAAA